MYAMTTCSFVQGDNDLKEHSHASTRFTAVRLVGETLHSRSSSLGEMAQKASVAL